MLHQLLSLPSGRQLIRAGTPKQDRPAPLCTKRTPRANCLSLERTLLEFRYDRFENTRTDTENTRISPPLAPGP